MSDYSAERFQSPSEIFGEPAGADLTGADLNGAVSISERDFW